MRFAPRYERRLPSEATIEVQRILSPLALIALVLVTITYSFGFTRPDVLTISEISSKHFTALTPNSIMTYDVFVGVMYVTQIAYICQLLSTQIEALLISVTEGVSYHFFLYCILQIISIVSWAHGKFAITEVSLIVNLVNLLSLYLRLGPTPHHTTVRKNVYLQIPVVKMPVALTIFWLWQNTAVLLDGSKQPKWLPDVFLAAVLVLLSLLVFLPRDSLLGLASCYLMFSLGTEQFLHRNYSGALFIVVFAAASLLFFLVAAVGVPRFRHALKLNESPELAPLLGR